MSALHATLTYPAEIEEAIRQISEFLRGDYPLGKHTLALLLLQEDDEIWQMVRQQETSATLEQIRSVLNTVKTQMDSPIGWAIEHQRQQVGQQISQQVLQAQSGERAHSVAEWTGFPILALVLYFGLYQFVGVFGAGTVVGWIEEDLFGGWINPAVESFVRGLVPWKAIQELLVGEYGVWTLGVTYAVALILPIVTFFFLVFAVLEDSGYLPRLAMLIDRAFKGLGLNGRAVIPIVLGFGCDTMATMVPRVLETRRERVLATFLLTLTIPCSAQLGVVLALLARYPTGLLIWMGVLVGVFLTAGWIAARVIPGNPMPFYMELPPIRLPSLSNVLLKTMARLHWYFLEVFPLFLLASVLIWVGQLTGLFDWALRAIAPITGLLGLPDSAGVAFLFGFFRRDYGAAGLYDLQQAGLLTGNQVLIVAVVLTLFVPCVAQFLVTLKERGWKAALAMFVISLGVAIWVGWMLKLALSALGVVL